MRTPDAFAAAAALIVAVAFGAARSLPSETITITGVEPEVRLVLASSDWAAVIAAPKWDVWLSEMPSTEVFAAKPTVVSCCKSVAVAAAETTPI